MPTLRGMIEAVFWMVMAAALMFGIAVLVGWGGLPILSWGGAIAILLLFPLVLRIATVARKRRGAAVLTYVEQAVRLNLPLAGMIDAARRSEQGVLADRLGALSRQLQSGAALGSALRASTPELGAAPPAMLEAGERLGRLPHVLRRLVQQMSVATGADASDAVFFRAYPFVMTIVMALAVSLFAIFVMPKYQTIFHDFGTKLPDITQFVIDIAGAMGPFLLALAILLMLAWAGMSLWKIVHPASADWSPLHRWRDRIVWVTPLLHGLARDRGLSDSLDLIAEALRAGQPIDRATREASLLRVNAVLRARLDVWSRLLTAGQPIGESARTAKMPELLVGMLATVRSGDQAADVMDFVARYCDARFSRMRVLVRAAAVPAMVFFFAFLVAAIAVAMLTPMASLINLLSSPSSRWSI